MDRKAVRYLLWVIQQFKAHHVQGKPWEEYVDLVTIIRGSIVVLLNRPLPETWHLSSCFRGFDVEVRV